MAHVQTLPVRIRERNVRVPAELEQILGRMLAKDPADRFATPADLVAAVQPFCAGAKLIALTGAKITGSQPTATASSQ